MIKILSIFGTRPEAIKFAPIIKLLETKTDLIESKICSTGQHKELLNQVLEIFSITPDYNLHIMKHNQGLPELASALLLDLPGIINDAKPDLVLVQGDTTTSAIASLACFYSEVCIGHIEAGLRTHNKYAPYPEEVNRKIIDATSDVFFATTEVAKSNLLREGMPEENIYITGNTAIDALLMVKSQIETRQEIIPELVGLDWNTKTILVTMHRRESYGVGFNIICNELLEISKLYPNVNIVCVTHLNPNTRNSIFHFLEHVPNIYLIPPQDYRSFVWLMHKSHLILTDSGGVQEEAPTLGTPVLVMREVTERIEGLRAGTLALTGIKKNAIVENVSLLLQDHQLYTKMSQAKNPYGNGTASTKIVQGIIDYINRLQGAKPV